MDNALVLSDEQLEAVVGGSGGFNVGSYNFNGNGSHNNNGNGSHDNNGNFSNDGNQTNYADVSSSVSKSVLIGSPVGNGNFVWQYS